MPQLPVIDTFGLSKRYGGSKKYALHNLSLSIEEGEVYGFLGPNGAGKSTTIRLLLNFIQPTHGQATILGWDMVKDALEIKRDIGYLAGEVALYDKMTGRHFLDYMSRLQPPRRPSYQGHLVQRFKAELNKPIKDLSKGNRQKIGLIQALMHEPEVLILDEPTSGLDPLMQETFFELVAEFKERKSTFFISSHNLSEVQKMCDKVGFIRDGKLIREQSLSAFGRAQIQTFDISFAEPVPEAALKRLGKLRINSRQHATVQIRGALNPLFATLSRYKVRSLNQHESDLEEEFLSFYKGTKV